MLGRIIAMVSYFVGVVSGGSALILSINNQLIGVLSGLVWFSFMTLIFVIIATIAGKNQ